MAWLQVQQGHCDGQGKPPRTRAARVEVEHLILPFDLRFVAVAIDDGTDAGGLGTDVEVLERVHHVQEVALQLNHLGCGEGGAGAAGIDISADGSQGSEGSELFQDAWIADVAGVEQVIGAAKRVHRLGAEEAVGVGEDADGH